MELKVSIQTKGAIFEGKAPEIMQKALEDAMYEATSYLEREVKKLTPVGVFGASGGLVSTIYGEVVGRGTPLVKGIVGTQSAYGEVIEKGRRAGKTWPPEGALLRWIEEKIAAPIREVTSIGEAVAVTRWKKSLEFVIRRKIGQKGFPGVHMFENALNQGWPRLMKIFDDAGFSIAKQLNEQKRKF